MVLEGASNVKMAASSWPVAAVRDASVLPSVSVGSNFPKSSRLLKKKDFRFRPYHKFQTKHFQLVYTLNGRGRIGISIAKRVLKRSVWRNRIRRLIREAFRHQKAVFERLDLHVVAQPALLENWENLKRQDVEHELKSLVEKLERKKDSV